jgi:hypothetical protein
MNHRTLKQGAIGLAAATLLATVIGTGAKAAPIDRTPPTAPRIVYAQGFFCWVFYIGAMRVTDNVTPEPQIRYEVFANGQFIGLLDRGSPSTAWGDLRLRVDGPNLVYVVAVDAAGNRSRSTTATVRGFDCIL